MLRSSPELAVSVISGSTVFAQPNFEPLTERSGFDYSPLVFQEEIAQAQPIVSKDQPHSVAADEATGPDRSSGESCAEPHR